MALLQTSVLQSCKYLAIPGILSPSQLAMAAESPDVNPYEELGLLSDETMDTPEQGPRCARCGQVKLHEWINWQKCWSIPCTGAVGRIRILVYPMGRHPMMFLLHSQGTAEDIVFWWFFICTQCRHHFRGRGLITECSEIEDRYCAGVNCKGLQVRATLVPQNQARNRIINGPLGVSEYWSRSPSPSSSDTSDPWTGPFTGLLDNSVNAPN